MKVGLIGLGVMGSAIGALLVRSGAEVRGCDVDEARRAQLRAAGGQIASSPAEAARDCPVVLTSLPTADAFEQVVSGPDGLVAAGAAVTVVELSTLAIADKQRARDALAVVGARLVDSPLSGTGAQARFGDLVAYVSADDPADRECAIDVLARFTRAQYDVGGFGNGSRFKFVANLLVAIHNVAAAEALVLAEQADLDPGLVLDAVADGAGGSRMLDIRGPLMTARSYDDPTVRLSVFSKDIRLIGEFAASVGAATPLFTASRSIYDTALAAGRADQDSACVAEVLRSDANSAAGGAPEAGGTKVARPNASGAAGGAPEAGGTKVARPNASGAAGGAPGAGGTDVARPDASEAAKRTLSASGAELQRPGADEPAGRTPQAGSDADQNLHFPIKNKNIDDMFGTHQRHKSFRFGTWRQAAGVIPAGPRAWIRETTLVRGHRTGIRKPPGSGLAPGPRKQPGSDTAPGTRQPARSASPSRDQQPARFGDRAGTTRARSGPPSRDRES